jgi:DNA-binding response OmpR family regulator
MMLKILLIDDEKAITKMLKKFLESHDYEVITAGDGVQGVALYKEHHPDLVITDLIMPEKEGLETIGELKQIDPAVKIIAMSGGGINTPETYLFLAKKFGAITTFEKPIDNEELLAEVRSILHDEL